MLRKLLGSVMVVALLLICSQPLYAANVVWKFSHHRTIGSPMDKDVKYFAAEVEKGTSGRVKIKVFPAAQLGITNVAIERTSMGAIDALIGYPSTEFDPKLDVYAIPGMIMNYEEYSKLYTGNTPYRALINKLFEDNNLHVVCTWMDGFTGAAFSKIPKDIKNANAKHSEKIRVPSLNTYRFVAESFGFMGTPLPSSEVFTALQTGIVEGTYGAGIEAVYLNFRDVTKCYLPVNVQPDVQFILVNKDVWNKLSREDQKTITEIGEKIEHKRIADCKRIEEEYAKKYQENGRTIIKLTKAEHEAFKKNAQDYSWPKLRKEIGEKVFDQAIDAWKKSL